MEEEPFLLHPSSSAFLDGDPRGIRERFAFQRDALDYLAMAAIAVGGLVILIGVARLVGGLPPDRAETTVAAFVVAAVLIAMGGYFVNSRHSWAAAHARLIREGQLLPGTIVSCAGRDETETGFGAVTRSYLVSVEYRFVNPNGQEVVGQAEQNRPDLRRSELPPDGTGVWVLYVDDERYALL
jgi:hypothetical protein